jgi:hypothetical protein
MNYATKFDGGDPAGEFPGLAVPMVFFPALAWITFKPLFVPDE